MANVAVPKATVPHSDQSSGDTHLVAAFATPNTHPVANVATPKATADGIESGPGESKSLSEKDAPEVMTTLASQDVENESSGDAHPVASETSIGPNPGLRFQQEVEIAQAHSGALSSNQSSGDTHPVANAPTPKVVTTPTSQYVETESSGDTHPVARETSIESKVEQCIQEIIDIAQADNGALLKGDSQQCARYKEPQVSMAAQDLLATLCHTRRFFKRCLLSATTGICQSHCRPWRFTTCGGGLVCKTSIV